MMKKVNQMEHPHKIWCTSTLCGGNCKMLGSSSQWWIQNFLGTAYSKGGCEKLLFGQFFPKNCAKLKEFEPRGARITGVPLDQSKTAIITSHHGSRNHDFKTFTS